MKFLALLALFVAAPAAAEPAPEPTETSLIAELEFGEGSARLPASAGARLGLIAAWASEHGDRLVVIDGHADARGAAAGSVRLSIRRARLVRDELIALGVDPSQILISAFGAEARPRARVAVWGAEREAVATSARRPPVP